MRTGIALVFAAAVNISSEAWTAIGLGITGAFALAVAIRNSRATTTAATKASLPDEVRSLGERLDTQAERMDKQDRIIRLLYDYIAQDHADHRLNGWDIRPLPEELK